MGCHQSTAKGGNAPEKATAAKETTAPTLLASEPPKTAAAPAKGETAKLVGAGSDAKLDDGWIAETLASHNALRAKHGAPPLVWSAECAAKAQLAADAAAAKNELFHSHCQEYGHGQNAFGGTAGHYGAEDAVEAWYSELKNPGYTWDNNLSPNGCPGCGHFTQVVWKDAQEVGMACDSSGKGFIFANYWPAGNMQGIYDKNVFKEGTAMQTRKLVRREPYSKTVTAMDEEVQSVLDSIPQEDVGKMIVGKLAEGWTVKLDYKPSPGGSLTYEISKDGAMSSGSCGF